MDKNVIIFTSFFLLFFFTFSFARTPFDSNEINVDDILIDHHSSIPLSQNNIINNNNPIDDNSILLPTTDSKMETPMSTRETNQPLPFTVFRYEPSRIPRHPSRLSFRPIHRCHHNHHYRPWNDPNFLRRGGNDIKDKEFDQVARGGARRIPAEWMSFDHNINEPMFSRERSNKMAMEKNELLRRLYHRYHKRRRVSTEPEINDTGLVKRIRKFLNRF